MSPTIEAMFTEARARLHAAIDLRAALFAAQRKPNYRRSLGQRYKRRSNGA